MSYSTRFSERNASAAKDWAAERQAKINRAKQLREERKRGTVDQECTFEPQKFNDYEPAVGSSKQGNLSEYSQEYLRDFHFSQREEEEHPAGNPEMMRKASSSSFASQGSGGDSFGIHHTKGQKSRGTYQGGPSAVNHAGQMIASRNNYGQYNNAHQNQGYNQPPPHHGYNQQQEPNGYHHNYQQGHPQQQYQQYPPNHRGHGGHSYNPQQQQYNPNVYRDPQTHYNGNNNGNARGGQFQTRQYQEPSFPEYTSPRDDGFHQSLDPYSIPPSNRGPPASDNNSYYNNGSYQQQGRGVNRQERAAQGYDSLSSEMMRHGHGHGRDQGRIHYDDEDPCDMSYEFAASQTRPQPTQNTVNRGMPQHQTEPSGYDEHIDGEVDENLGGSGRLGLLRSKRPVNADRGQYSRSAGPSRPMGGGQEVHPNDRDYATETSQRSASARPRLDAQPATAGARAGGSMSCTRQSGCQCPQCGADSAFQQSQSATSGSSRFNENEPDMNATNVAARNPAIRKGRSAGKRKSNLDKRPPWNSEFAEEEQQDPFQQDSNQNFEQEQPQQPPPRQGVRGNSRKQEWNSDFSSAGQQPPMDEDSYQRPPSGRAPPNGNSNRMRDELRGGMGDFIDQAHAATKTNSRDTFGGGGMNRPVSGSRGAQPRQMQPHHSQQQQQQGMRQGSQRNVNVQYRGMYKPEQDEPADYGSGGNYNQQRQPATRQPQNHHTQPQQQKFDASTEGMPNDDQIAVGSGQKDTMGIPEFATPEQLSQCPTCSRTFNEMSFQKHVKLCQKVFQTKRKTFDVSKARLADAIQNPDDARVVKQAIAKKGKPDTSVGKKKGNKWKQQSQALREAMKYNKLLTQAKSEGKNIASLPPPPEDTNNDYVPCPHCGRTFNENAAERHIPKCKDQKAKPNRLVRGGGRNASIRVKR